MSNLVVPIGGVRAVEDDFYRTHARTHARTRGKRDNAGLRGDENRTSSHGPHRVRLHNMHT